jgi:hypothetical protein
MDGGLVKPRYRHQRRSQIGAQAQILDDGRNAVRLAGWAGVARGQLWLLTPANIARRGIGDDARQFFLARRQWEEIKFSARDDLQKVAKYVGQRNAVRHGVMRDKDQDAFQFLMKQHGAHQRTPSWVEGHEQLVAELSFPGELRIVLDDAERNGCSSHRQELGDGTTLTFHSRG